MKIIPHLQNHCSLRWPAFCILLVGLCWTCEAWAGGGGGGGGVRPVSVPLTGTSQSIALLITSLGACWYQRRKRLPPAPPISKSSLD